MLQHLVIKNYALIQHLEMNPAAKLNIITGETGAGKSIMVGAVGLLLGNRADTKALYNENEKCVVEGTFDLKEYDLKLFFDIHDLDYSQQTIIRREINPNGKSRAFVNDLPVTLDILKELGSNLMDVHSQHDTLQLASNDYQLSIIDAFAGTQIQLKKYEAAYYNFKSAQKEFKSLESEAANLKKEADYNAFLLDELEKLELQPDEQERLEEELNILENAEEIKSKLNHILHFFDQDESSAAKNLSQGIQVLNQLSRLSDKYSSLAERAESCLIELRDIASELENEEMNVDVDPAKLEYTQNRLSNIYQLQQKHQVNNIDALIKIQETLAEKVSKTINLDDELKARNDALQKLKAGLMAEANQLSTARNKTFDKLTSQMKELLKDLGMPDATLQVEHDLKKPTHTGIDEINLRFSANKGVRPQSLKNVASGGEFARLMFCVKYVLADKTAMPTIVFDEIDTGISGEIALKMVKMMESMASNHQVLVITHLPQIAAKGEQHYFVFKDTQTSKTVSKIKLLQKKERIEEIAKMIGGDKPSTIALENARELLEK
jgi:DNA repair protein RecN (Recombination protein N)